jgi:hypothetical protein
MKETIRAMEVEDEVNRQKKRGLHMKYQRDLDSQLGDLRSRSIRSLQGQLLKRLKSLWFLCWSLLLNRNYDTTRDQVQHGPHKEDHQIYPEIMPELVRSLMSLRPVHNVCMLF